jgi:4-hydroxy-tetrahydrodipicolinate reductase
MGANGRMGKWVSHLVSAEFSKQANLLSHGNKNQSPSGLLRSQVVIDFSNPAGMTDLAELALKEKGDLPAFVVGTTGWSAEGRKILAELAHRTPVLVASNFSVGVSALSEILRTYSSLLHKLGYKPVIVETHHIHKKDAPSGTALSLQHVIAPKSPEAVQTHSVRAGEVIGDHEVTFYGQADKISLGHFAQDRSIFARGSIQVALWLAPQRKNRQLHGSIIGIEKYFESIQEGIK